MIFRNYFCNFRLMLRNVSQNKHIMILHTILLFLATTLPSIVLYSGIHERYTDFSPDYSLYIYDDIFRLLSFSSPYQMLIVVAVAIITSFCCYSYLNSTKALIFHNSMPYKRSNLYFTRFVSGLIQLAVPVIIIACVNTALFYSYDVSNYCNATYSDFAVNTLICIFMYSLCFAVGAFTANISSNVFAQGISVLFVFLAYILTIGIIAGNFETWFDTYFINLDFDGRYIFPPCVIAEGDFTANVLIYDICYFITLTALGCVAAVKRPTENTNKFFAFGFINVFLKYYIALFASLGFGLIFADISDGNLVLSIIGYVLFGFLAFSALQAIFEKNIRAMFTNLKGFAVLTVILTCVLFIPCSGLYDFDNKVPMSAPWIRIDNISFLSELTLKEPDNVAAALKLAEAGKNTTLEVRREGKGSGTKTSYIEMEIGNPVISRRFSHTPNSAINEFVALIYDSDECQRHISSLFENGEIEFIEKNNLTSGVNFNNNKFKKSRDELKLLLEKESAEASYNDISSSYVYAYVNLRTQKENIRSGYVTIPVYSCYDESVEFIKDKFFISPPPDIITLSDSENGNAEITITDAEAIEFILARSCYSYYHYFSGGDRTEYEAHTEGTYIGPVSLTDEELSVLKAK